LSGSTAIPFSTADGGPPEGGGGSLTPGMYQLAGRTFYVVLGNPNLPPVTRKGVMQVTSTDLTVSLDPSIGSAHSVTVSYTISGDNLIEVPLCFVVDGGTSFIPPDSGLFPPTPVPFAATSTTITTLGALSEKVTLGPDGGQIVTDEGLEYFTFAR